jgi:hypothetical protein
LEEAVFAGQPISLFSIVLQVKILFDTFNFATALRDKKLKTRIATGEMNCETIVKGTLSLAIFAKA